MAKRKENPMSPSDRGRLGGLSVKNRATLVENKGHEWLVQRGRTQGRKNVESGFMGSIRTIESASKGGTTIAIANGMSPEVSRIRSNANFAQRSYKRSYRNYQQHEFPHFPQAQEDGD
jgi:hypothetical protein